MDGIAVGEDGVARCWWGSGDPLREYHDREWGRPVDDDGRLFEKICLEGFMAGLSWLTILRKRDNFRAAFADFDAAVVAHFTQADVDRLMNDAGIVRNRAKIEATVNNAVRCQALAGEFGSLAAYVWGYEPAAEQRPARLDQAALMQITTAPEAVAMSKDLRKRGWSFVGPTTIYSFMQAVGVVNDHLDECAVGMDVEERRSAFPRPRRAKPSATD
jgi:DNA-3-methyladenine glycosylase I